MQRITFLVAALAALSTAAPVEGAGEWFAQGEALVTYTDLNEVPCTASYEEHMRNASAAFGWQLAGAAKDTDELDTTCSGLKDGAYSKWANQGLVIDNIAGQSTSQTSIINV